MRSLFRVIAVVALGLLPAATGFAQDLSGSCAVSGNPALEHSLGPIADIARAQGHRDCGWFGVRCVDWGHVGHTALTIADDVSTVAGIGVTAAVFIGLSPAWLPIAAATLSTYGLVRWGSVLVSRGVEGKSIDPIHDADARRAWLTVASNVIGFGTARAIALGSRPLAIGTIVASNVAGAGGTITGVVQTLEQWRNLSNGERMTQLAHDVAGLPNDPPPAHAK